MYSKPQKIVAEFIGTFALVFFGAGAVIADQFLRTNATGQPGFGLLGIALAQGLAFGIMVTALGHISGGHFNPAITIGFWVTRKISSFDAITYWIAQVGGGIAAAYLLRTLPFEAWGSAQLGTPDLAIGVTRAIGLIFEAVMTFFLVFVFFATTVDDHGASRKTAGFAVGLTITIAILVGAPFTGAALNPARVLGSAIASNHWTNHGVYWFGPLGGGVVAGWLYDTLFLSKKEL
ncbi:MAG TPA: MIP family channel protein [Candidatus Acidoferrales bacterium]|jgi:glycerol uptake facilitator protein|nr:MIP family channel protein [Candidatus Acidoferrales bacterium]